MHRLLVTLLTVAAAATAGRRVMRVLAIAGLAALSSGWSTTRLLPLVGADPANPWARVAPLKYRSTLNSYISRRPVEAAPWGAAPNDRAAPPGKP
jgi:hypothetical protein